MDKSTSARKRDKLKTTYIRHEQPMYWQAMHQMSMAMHLVSSVRHNYNANFSPR